jgi:hypothetical protein
MEYFHNKLCISGSELIFSPENPDGVMSIYVYKSLVNRRRINVVRRGCRNTPALVEFNSLPFRYLKKIIDQLGWDPRRRTLENGIAQSLEKDLHAREFFAAHRLPNGEILPEGAIEEYCTNADILHTIFEMANRLKGTRRAGGGSTHGMWEELANELKTLDRAQYPHSLPTHPVRLREKLNRYLSEGLESLIHKGYGNRNTEKLSEESRRWLLARWSNMVEKVTSPEHLMELYNQEAVQRGWKLLQSISTIRNFLFDPEVKHLWWGVRYGHIDAKNKFAMQHSTKLPTMRDSLWYSDGTKLNYFYINDEGKIETCMVYEVMDAYSEVLLGYHISKSEDYQAQYAAYKMAIQFSGQKPYQLGYDNQGGHKKLENGSFLTKIARLAIKTQPYNGKSKTIENAFSRYQSMFLKKDWFFTGQNITTKRLESHANREFILTNKDNLPTLDQVKKIYAQRRAEWNAAAHPATGRPRLEMYQQSQNPEAVKINMWDMVEIFWITRPEPVMLSAYGLSFVDRKEKHDYMVYKDGMPDIEWLRRNIDKKFFVKYDPDDMSLVMLYDQDGSGRLRFVTEATVKVTVARGKQEQTSDDLSFITRVNHLNKVEAIKSVDKIEEVMREFKMHPENYGMKVAGIPGISKSKGRGKSIGKVQKAISNAVPVDDDEEINIYELM